MAGSLLSLPASRSPCSSSCELLHGQRTGIRSTLLSSGGAGSSFLVARSSSLTGDRLVIGRCSGLRPSLSRFSQLLHCWGRYGTTPMKVHLCGSWGKPSSSSSAVSPSPLRRQVRRDGSAGAPAEVAGPRPGAGSLLRSEGSRMRRTFSSSHRRARPVATGTSRADLPGRRPAWPSGNDGPAVTSLPRRGRVLGYKRRFGRALSSPALAGDVRA